MLRISDVMVSVNSNHMVEVHPCFDVETRGSGRAFKERSGFGGEFGHKTRDGEAWCRRVVLETGRAQQGGEGVQTHFPSHCVHDSDCRRGADEERRIVLGEAWLCETHRLATALSLGLLGVLGGDVAVAANVAAVAAVDAVDAEVAAGRSR